MLNALPRVVLAPIFMLWLGLGIWSKVALGVTLVFFIVFFNVYQGVKEVSPAVLANARMLGMNERQLFAHVYWPSALSWMFSSLHTSVGFAIIGAVVGEYLGSAAGLGYLIQQAEGTFDTTGVFAGMVILAVFVLVIDWLVTLVENRLLVWRPDRRRRPGLTNKRGGEDHEADAGTGGLGSFASLGRCLPGRWCWRPAGRPGSGPGPGAGAREEGHQARRRRRPALYYLPLALTEKLGFFKEQGLNVEINDFKGGSQSLTALIGGSADVVTGAYEHTLRMQVKGQDILAVIELGRYPGISLAVKKDRADKIKSLADLKGAKIGVTAPGSSTNMIVWYLMAKAGLKPDDASFIGVGAGGRRRRRHPEGRDRRHLQHRSRDGQAASPAATSSSWPRRAPPRAPPRCSADRCRPPCSI